MKGRAPKVSCSSQKVGGKTWRPFWRSVKNAQFHPTKHLSWWVLKLEAEWKSTPSIFRLTDIFNFFVPDSQASSKMTKCHQVLSSVMKSYQVLSSVIKGYQVLSSVIKWYQVVSSFIKCNQVLSDDASVIKCYHVLSTVITCYHVVSSVIKWPFYGHSNLGADWTLVVNRHRP